ncbi:unnamed protein product, partial [Effrenium voratum]
MCCSGMVLHERPKDDAALPSDACMNAMPFGLSLPDQPQLLGASVSGAFGGRFASRAAMVIKTDLCNYTEYRIYPGHGQKFIAKDAKVSFFITAKADSLYHQRIKPVKLRWTQAWRRMNKKGKVEEGAKKRTRKAQKFQKAIVGMSLDDIKKKKAMRPELRNQREQAAK